MIDQQKDISCTVGVGDGMGDLYVHGSYDAIKRVQEMILEKEKIRRNTIIEVRNELLRHTFDMLHLNMYHTEAVPKDTIETLLSIMDAAYWRDHGRHHLEYHLNKFPEWFMEYYKYDPIARTTVNILAMGGDVYNQLADMVKRHREVVAQLQDCIRIMTNEQVERVYAKKGKSQ